MKTEWKASGESRSLALELEVPGTPEQVWRAFATGPGITSWFIPAKVEEKVGGQVVFEIAPGVDAPGTITGWEPPHRFGYEEVGWSGEAPPLVTEIHIEARDGGVCVIRMVHSLATGSDEWDESMKSFEAGWNSFFDVLQLYMRHFEGQPCSAARVMGRSTEGEAEAWKALREALGLTEAAPGTRWSPPAGVPKVTGVVEREGSRLVPQEILLRLDEPAPGLALIGAYDWGGAYGGAKAVHTAMSFYFYGHKAAEALDQEGPAWTAWMQEHFPAPPAEEGEAKA